MDEQVRYNDELSFNRNISFQKNNLSKQPRIGKVNLQSPLKTARAGRLGCDSSFLPPVGVIIRKARAAKWPSRHLIIVSIRSKMRDGY